MAQEAVEQGKVLGAICMAPVILAQAVREALSLESTRVHATLTIQRNVV